jgi:translation initiation factor IF-2
MSQPTRPTVELEFRQAEAAPDGAVPSRGARAGFVGAFVRTVRPGRASSPAGRIAVGALVVVAVAGVVVGAGALLGDTGKQTVASSAGSDQGKAAALPSPSSPSGSPSGSPSVGANNKRGQAGTGTGGKKAAPPAKPVTFQGVSGRGCTSATVSYAEYGWYNNGDAGWWTLGGGSWTGDGCNGQFSDMPMSGNANADTAGQAMMWGFTVGPRAQDCTLSVYVPTSSSARDVAVTAAHFAVVNGTTMSSITYADPSGDRFIDQRDHHSAWLPLGTYPVRNGTIGVRLTNRGDPNGYPETFPHLAGGAVKVECRG